MEAVKSEAIPIRRPVNPLLWLSLAILALIVILLGFKIGASKKPSFKFVTSDHPIEMWNDGTDKWSYYSLDSESDITVMATAARTELLPLGFTEDTTHRPWFRFTKDNQEVVVCYHYEFGVRKTGIGRQLFQQKLPTGMIPPNHKWQCVLIKNGPGT